MRFNSGDADIDHVVASELRLHDPAVRRSAGESGGLLDPEFREFGASARVWNRESILEMMRTDDSPLPIIADITAARLVPDVILLTYRSHRPDRDSLRSSVWRRRDGGPWRLNFHQGTVRPLRA